MYNKRYTNDMQNIQTTFVIQIYCVANVVCMFCVLYAT